MPCSVACGLVRGERCSAGEQQAQHRVPLQTSPKSGFRMVELIVCMTAMPSAAGRCRRRHHARREGEQQAATRRSRRRPAAVVAVIRSSVIGHSSLAGCVRRIATRRPGWWWRAAAMWPPVFASLCPVGCAASVQEQGAGEGGDRRGGQQGAHDVPRPPMVLRTSSRTLARSVMRSGSPLGRSRC